MTSAGDSSLLAQQLTKVELPWHAHGMCLCLRVFHGDISIKGVESKPLSLVTAQLQVPYEMLLLLV